MGLDLTEDDPTLPPETLYVLQEGRASFVPHNLTDRGKAVADDLRSPLPPYPHQLAGDDKSHAHGPQFRLTGITAATPRMKYDEFPHAPLRDIPAKAPAP